MFSPIYDTLRTYKETRRRVFVLIPSRPNIGETTLRAHHFRLIRFRPLGDMDIIGHTLIWIKLNGAT